MRFNWKSQEESVDLKLCGKRTLKLLYFFCSTCKIVKNKCQVGLVCVSVYPMIDRFVFCLNFHAIIVIVFVYSMQ